MLPDSARMAAQPIEGRPSPGMQPAQARSGGEAMSAAYNDHKVSKPPPPPSPRPAQ